MQKMVALALQNQAETQSPAGLLAIPGSGVCLFCIGNSPVLHRFRKTI